MSEIGCAQIIQQKCFVANCDQKSGGKKKEEIEISRKKFIRK